MNRTFLIFLMVSTALLIAVIGQDDNNRSPDTMPWNIQQLDNGSTRVFGITLGKTDIQDAHQILARFSETRLFTDNDQLELRAHFDQFTLGGLLAEIDLIYDLSQTQLAEIQQQAINSEKGNYQILNDGILMELLNVAVRRIIYTPDIDYDENIILQNFGQETERTTVNETTEQLSYPALGLVILLDQQGPEKFIYSIKTDQTSPAN